MLTRGRLLLVLGVVVVGAGAWLLWNAFAVRADLADAEAAAEDLQTAVRSDDVAAREDALDRFQAAASSAADRTGGPTWRAATWLPLVGDDAEGARALAHSLDILGEDAVVPLLEVLDGSARVVRGGAVDLSQVRRLESPLAEASGAVGKAAALVEGLDASGYAGPVKGRFERYVESLTRADRTLASAVTAAEVLPPMLGADGPKDYLLLFQNNAEIRATGGMPGSWAQLHAEGGRLSLTRQGTAGDFPSQEEPVVPLSEAELQVYDRQLGTYFQDIGFTPDFPRAAEIAEAHWAARFPQTPLDGVIALDPVALSYLLEATGPVEVGGRQLTTDNAVAELLNTPYLTLEPAAQDAFFAAAARSIFDAVTAGSGDAVALTQALDRAAAEGRLLVAARDARVREALAGSDVEGALAGDDGGTPHVDIGLNDATGSKMSYYLRYQAEVQATGCSGGRQTLSASMNLAQAIEPREAAALPDSVTGGGNYGTPPGSQLLLVRLYAPFGGELETIHLNGKRVRVEAVELDGRPTATVVVLLADTRDVVLTWSMRTGEGQRGPGELQMTPGVVPGGKTTTFASAC